MSKKLLLLVLALGASTLLPLHTARAVTVECVSAPSHCTPDDSDFICPVTGNPTTRSLECPIGGYCELQGDLECGGVMCGVIVMPVCDTVASVVTCSSDAGCNDSDTCTTDVCNNPGTVSSSCSNTDNGTCGTVACSSDSNCNDNNTCTNDTCNNPGSTSSSCSNTSNGTCGGVCGDNACNNGENCSSCGTDCGTCTGSPVCGNGAVESGESCDAGSENGNCPATCSASCTINGCAPKGWVVGRYAFDVNGNGSFDAGIDRIMQDVGSPNQCNQPSDKFSTSGIVAIINGSNLYTDFCNPEPYYREQFPHGTYNITAQYPSDWVPTSTFPVSVTISGTTAEPPWFLFTRKATFFGRYVYDKNGNGVYDGADQIMQDINAAPQCGLAPSRYGSTGIWMSAGATDLWMNYCNPEPHYQATLNYGTYALTPHYNAVAWEPVNLPTSVTLPTTGDPWFFFKPRGVISVNSNNPSTTWCVTGAGCGAGSATFTSLVYDTYSINSIVPPTGYSCSPDAWSKAISPSDTNKVFTIICTALGGTVTSISSPRNSVLTSSGQASGVISGTFTGGSGSGYQANIVIRNFTGCQDWIGTGWTNCGALVPAGNITVNGSTWTVSGAGVPPLNQMTSGNTYQVYLQVGDSTGSWSNWISGPIVLFDSGAPSGTISAITTPATTVLTSDGSPLGTIVGTAFDSVTNVTSLTMVIREWNGTGSEGACDTNNRDWNGSSWQAACTAGLSPTFTPGQNITWSFSGTPPSGQMTYNRRYRIYLNVTDAVGNSSNWSPNTLVHYLPAQAPTASNVKVTKPDYCTTGPSGTISWSYSDLDGSPQGAYQVQIDNDAGFTSPVFDSGKVSGTSTSVYASSGLTWGTTYYSRVKVWDTTDLASAWTTQTQCQGPPGNPSGCSGGNTSWLSPAHAYPSNINTFSWSPTKPPIGDLVTFSTGSTTCYSSGVTPGPCTSWLWSFGDSGTSTLQSPTHTYTTPGAYSIGLSVFDGSFTCAQSIPKTLTIQQNIPTFKEILPR